MGETKALVLDTWAGRRYYPVDAISETPKKVRVRIRAAGGVMLPGRRYVQCGEEVLVPKHAVVDLPADEHKIEHGYYDELRCPYCGHTAPHHWASCSETRK